MPKNQNISGSIAEAVLNTSDDKDVYGSLAAAYQALAGERIGPLRLRLRAAQIWARAQIESHFVDYSSDHSLYQGDVDFTERRITSMALRNIFVRRRQAPNTMLNTWPLFDHLQRRHGRRSETPVSRALLIGSLTPITSRTFNVMAGDVFGANQTFVADIRSGKDKARRENGTLIYGNGLQLPFRNESMNTVCTNYLLHMIIDANQTVTNASSEQGIANDLLGEAYRVLVPGGQLFMREVVPRLNFEDKDCRTKYNRTRVQEFTDEMRTGLVGAGFSDFALEASWEKDGVDYLFDPERAFNTYDTVATPTSIGIYAFKAA